jgi:hypothetical protein
MHILPHINVVNLKSVYLFLKHIYIVYQDNMVINKLRKVKYILQKSVRENVSPN